MGTLGIESAIVMTMQQSLTKMKTIAACEQVYSVWEKSRASGKQNKTR